MLKQFKTLQTESRRIVDLPSAAYRGCRIGIIKRFSLASKRHIAANDSKVIQQTSVALNSADWKNGNRFSRLVAEFALMHCQVGRDEWRIPLRPKLSYSATPTHFRLMTIEL